MTNEKGWILLTGVGSVLRVSFSSTTQLDNRKGVWASCNWFRNFSSTTSEERKPRRLANRISPGNEQ